MKKWKTPTRGTFNFNEMCNEIKQFIIKSKNNKCKITIGTDSQEHSKKFKFVTAIVVHRMNNGAQYYYKVEYKKHINSLKQKIMYESLLTLKYKQLLKDKINVINNHKIIIEPHCDIGTNGPTKKLISEISGMFKGYDINELLIIKPDSYAASSVANKHSK